MLDGFRLTLRGWIGNSSLNEPWVAQFPILGKLDFATFVAVVLLVVGGFLIHRFLNKPKTADLLIETESELKKSIFRYPEESGCRVLPGDGEAPENYVSNLSPSLRSASTCSSTNS